MSELGAQLAIVSQPRRAIAAWSDTRRATVDNVAQDLAAATIVVDPATARRLPFAAFGAALVLGGATLAARSGRRPNRASANDG